MLSLADRAQDIGSVVLVKHILVVFPDVDVFLAHAEQHGDILLADDMSLAEHGVLGDARDDLGDVMAEHLPDRILHAHQFHAKASNSKIRTAVGNGNPWCVHYSISERTGAIKKGKMETE